MKKTIITIKSIAAFAGISIASASQAADLKGSTLDFNSLDKNGDGKLSRTEFRSATIAPIAGAKASPGKGTLDTAPPPMGKPGSKNFTLRKSAFGVSHSGVSRVGPEFSEKFTDSPAELKWTRTGDGSEAYAIDAGAAMRVYPWKVADNEQPNFLAWLGVDYHRNSAAGALKDLTRVGLSLDWVPTSFDAAFGVVPTLDIFFENDNIADAQSFNTAITIAPFSQIPWLAKEQSLLGVISGKFSPFASVNFRTTTDTGTGVASGDLIFAKYGAEFQGYIAPGIIYKTLEVRASYTQWEPLTSSGVYDNFDSSGLFAASVTFNFANGYWFHGAKADNTFLGRPLCYGTMRDVEMGLKLEYTSGDDPEMGTKDADVLTLSLTAKY